MFKQIITHSGLSHPDETFSVGVILELFGPIPLLRTRNNTIIEQALHDPSILVLDVGGEYFPDSNNFDHHQIEGAGERPNKIPYATFGLVWKTFGLKFVTKLADTFEHKFSESELNDICRRIDQTLICFLDGVDNGAINFKVGLKGLPSFKQPNFSFPGIGLALEVFRPEPESTPEDQNKAFLEAAEFCRKLLVKETIRRLRGLIDISFVLSCDKGDKILVLPRYASWQPAMIQLPHVAHVVYPRNEEKNWASQDVPPTTYETEGKNPFPFEWRGLEGPALSEKTGVSDALFCHRTGFMVIAKTKEGAMALSQLSLKQK